MGFSNTNNLSHARNWKEANDVFDKKPPRAWPDRERPLGNNRQTHYKVQRNRDDSIDVILYAKVMARFFKPQDNGLTEVWYAHDSRVTSTMFMSDVLRTWQCKLWHTDDGRVVRVPIHKRLDRTRLIFDAKGLLVARLSQHAPIERSTGNPELTKFKREFRKSMRWLTEMLEMRERPARMTPQVWGPYYGSLPLSFYARDALAAGDAIDMLVTLWDNCYWNNPSPKTATTKFLQCLLGCTRASDLPKAQKYLPIEGLFHEELPAKWRFAD